MNPQTYAGLSDTQANQALCEWLNKRTGSQLESGARNTKAEWQNDVEYGEKKLVAVGEWIRGWWENGHLQDAPTHSHDSIHRVLDAMSDEEKSAYWENLRMTFHQTIRSPRESQTAFATPAQKTDAALLALGLGLTA